MSAPRKVPPALLAAARDAEDRRLIEAAIRAGSVLGGARAAGAHRVQVQRAIKHAEARLRRGEPTPGVCVGLPSPEQPRRPEPDVPALLAAIKARPLTRDALAAKLHADAGTIDRLLGQARWQDAPIVVHQGLVSYSPPREASDTVNPILPPAADGTTTNVGVISDTHYGSKFCMREQIRDCVQWMVDQGITLILHAGDWTQGIYAKHSVHEVSATSQRDQLLEMAEWLPRHPGLHYHGIAGNHDETWVDRTGLPFATALAGVWREIGRRDVTIYGSMGAFVDVGGVVVHLWHGGSVAYAASYHLQGKAESYAGIKPSVLLAGHVHRFCHVEQRGIECILCPCFQGGAGPFSKKMKGSPAIGGLVLSWRMSSGGSFRDFEIRRRRYYERERVHVASNPVHGDTVPEVVARVGITGYEEQP